MSTYARETWQHDWTDEVFDGWCAAMWDDGAFIAMDGGLMLGFWPAPKLAGFAAALNGMAPAEKERIWAHCIETLGYVARYGRHLSDNPRYR